MPMFRFFVILFCFFLTSIYRFTAQDSLHLLKNFDYRVADSLALNFPKKKYNSFTEIVSPLCSPLPTEHEKFRAIFRWITNNIEYNKSAAQVSEADKIVRKNKAVCAGFASLLKEMCLSAGIECEIITGHTKTDIREIGKKLKKTDHAWNAVKLYGRWYLVDVTWATSKYNVVTHKFEKNFDAHYFICPPEDFILDHFPKESTWQLLKDKMSAKTFIRMPLFYADFFHFDLAQFNPFRGSIRCRKNKIIAFEFYSTNLFSEVEYQYNTDRYAKTSRLFPTEQGRYRIEIPAPARGQHTLSIYLDRKIVLEYLVKVR
jgi:hypothetical protein